MQTDIYKIYGISFQR